MSRSKTKLAISPNTPIDVLWKLAMEDDELAILVASNPRCGDELVGRIYSLLLSQNYDLSAACEVLEGGNVSPTLLLKILDDFPDLNEERDVDYPGETSYGVLLAQHPDTPMLILEKLVVSPYYLVRERLSLRADLPLHVLEKLVRDECFWVRQELVCNPVLSPSGLQILAKDADPTIRFKVAVHPNATKEILELLATDNVKEISRAALCSLEAFENEATIPPCQASSRSDTRPNCGCYIHSRKAC